MRLISKKKIEQLRRKLKDKKLDVALFLTSEPIHDVNIEYFTSFQQTRFFSFGCLLMSQEKSILIVSPLSYDQALEEAEADEIINLDDYNRSLTEVLEQKLKKVKTIGVREDIFPYKLFKKFKHLKFKDISDVILEIRSIKEPKEVERVEKACRIADHGIKIIEENLSNKITEKELALILEQDLIRKGADELAFPTIVTSGKRSAYIHPYPSFSDQKIQDGLGLIDFGVRYKGYCSDVTVPFTLGKLSSKQKKIVRTVEKAHERAIAYLRTGLPTWKVHDHIENFIKRNGFKFKHSLGHGLGLELHDLPLLSSKPKSKEGSKDWKEIKLKENMTFTIEPGIYELGIGGCRLENDVLMTKKLPKVLTHSRLIEL
ncbi:MAG: Xaa-Pro peptidase family protein [Candidatus Aenigmarchaeota archaeon]|nr:Xaa-Pro peptidase family protein [Candidatus Aenigmarchaeota archaeon]